MMDRKFGGRLYRIVGISRAPAIGAYKTKSEAKKAASSFPNFYKRIIPKKSGGRTYGYDLYVSQKEKR